MGRVEQIGDATLYLGDCLEILPTLGKVDAVVTDPPWDQAKNIPGAENPRKLLGDAAPHISLATRAVMQLGCYTSPEMLTPIAARMPFLQAMWLKYACPSYRGRVLVNADVAYAYGKHIPSRLGSRVIPAERMSTGREPGESSRCHGRNRSSATANLTAATLPHPMARHVSHVRWLVQWWSVGNDVVCDPFMGSGTTGVACANLGRKFIGIEIEEKYFEIACERIDAAYRQQRLFA